MLCSEAIAVNPGGFQRAASILRCKRWSCEICQPRCRWKVIRAIAAGKPNRMLTLTCSHSAYATPTDAARDMMRGLRALRKRLARQWPNKKFPMAVVFEQHESGWPHMHIALRCEFIPIDWLKAAWLEITGAWNVDIRFIPDTGRIALYVAKYLGKDVHKFEGCKRWWRSHDFEIEKEESDIGVRFGFHWHHVTEAWDSFVARLKADDEFIVVRQERPGWIEWDDWLANK